jgi:NAD(P)-dependent dehydrogenase (short-subunit alcohol dehydrogenase family)
MYDFGGKGVIVTGASRGLGAALARAFAAEGANVALLARGAEAARAQAMALKKTLGVDAVGRECDIRDWRRVESVIHEVAERFGRLDLVVNNAGVLGAMTTIADYPVEAWELTISTNLSGAFHVSRVAAAYMRRHGGGRIVFVGSSVGQVIRENWGAYAVSKYAVEGLMRLMAAEQPVTQVTVCSVNPGGTATQMRREAYPSEDQSLLPSPAKVAAAFVRILRLSDNELNGRSFNARDFLPTA